MKQLYKCEACGFVSDDMIQISKCERKHQLLEEQSKVIAEEVDKFYRMGGMVNIYFGSADAKKLGDVVYSVEQKRLTFRTNEKDGTGVTSLIHQIGTEPNGLGIKNWTSGSFRKVLKIFGVTRL